MCDSRYLQSTRYVKHRIRQAKLGLKRATLASEEETKNSNNRQFLSLMLHCKREKSHSHFAQTNRICQTLNPSTIRCSEVRWLLCYTPWLKIRLWKSPAQQPRSLLPRALLLSSPSLLLGPLLCCSKFGYESRSQPLLVQLQQLFGALWAHLRNFWGKNTPSATFFHKDRGETWLPEGFRTGGVQIRNQQKISHRIE